MTTWAAKTERQPNHEVRKPPITGADALDTTAKIASCASMRAMLSG